MWEFVKRVLWSTPLVLAFTDCVASVTQVNGLSMQPTFNPDSSDSRDWVLVEKLSYKWWHNYQRGDVAIFW